MSNKKSDDMNKKKMDKQEVKKKNIKKEKEKEKNKDKKIKKRKTQTTAKNEDKKVVESEDLTISDLTMDDIKKMDISSLANYYVDAAKKHFIEYLIEDMSYKKEQAIEWTNIIDQSIRSKMRETYTYTGDTSIILESLRYLRINLDKMADKFDFISWAWTASRIPYYQSLGDTLGYYNGNWEFNYGDIKAGPEFVNELIYDFIYMGGVNDINIRNWLASDDTILYLATLRVISKMYSPLIKGPMRRFDIDELGKNIKQIYLDVMPKLNNRHPGHITMHSLEMQKTIAWDKLPYNSKSIGAGGAMRTGSIGIFFPGKQNRRRLIAYSVECCRITHNSAIAIMGSITASLFTAYSLERVSINLWPHKLLKLIRSGIIDEYIKNSRPEEYDFFRRDKLLYTGQWEKYVSLLFAGINPRTDLKFMKNPVQRYKYLSENFSKGCDIPGSCGDDALIMAYDALLRSDGVIEKLIFYAILHPGDSDTVGSIAFSWFGGFYHSAKNESLLRSKFMDLEYIDNLDILTMQNWRLMAKVYYYNIYVNIAAKYIKTMLRSKPIGILQ